MTHLRASNGCLLKSFVGNNCFDPRDNDRDGQPTISGSWTTDNPRDQSHANKMKGLNQGDGTNCRPCLYGTSADTNTTKSPSQPTQQKWPDLSIGAVLTEGEGGLGRTSRTGEDRCRKGRFPQQGVVVASGESGERCIMIMRASDLRRVFAPAAHCRLITCVKTD